MGEIVCLYGAASPYVPALIVLAGIGMLFAGVWFWNDYSYWSCVKHQVAPVLNETCL